MSLFVDYNRPTNPVVPGSSTVTPTPAVALPKWVVPVLVALTLGLATLGGFLAWDLTHRSSTAPDQPAGLAATFKAYHDSEGTMVKSLADQVRSGAFPKDSGQSDRTAVGLALKQHSAQLSSALNAYFDSHCDEKGNVISRSVVADDLAAAAKAMGAK